VTGPVILYLQQAGVGGLTADEAGTQKITQKEPSVFIQTFGSPAEPDDPGGAALGSANRAGPDHAPRPALLCRLHRQDE
jgi:hypothetical protein